MPRPGTAPTFRVLVALQPADALRLDRFEVLGAQGAAEAVCDRDQEAAGDEDPRLRVDVAVRIYAARRLRAAKHVGEVVVHLAHVTEHMAADLRILAGFGDRLHPEARQKHLP